MTKMNVVTTRPWVSNHNDVKAKEQAKMCTGINCLLRSALTVTLSTPDWV